MPKWVPGQSGNPKGRPRRGRSAAEMARAVSQERIEFRDEADKAVYTRLERLVRVLWTKALDGDLKSIRCLLEYMEGTPVQVITATVKKEGETLSADEMNALRAAVMAKVEEWQAGSKSGSSEKSG